MAKASSVMRWLCSIAIVLHAAANDSLGSLKVVNQQDFHLAAALDGNPPVFYVRPSPSTGTSKKKWVFYLDGGDFCGYGNNESEQLADCYRRSKTMYGSPNYYLNQTTLDMTDYSLLFDPSPMNNSVAHDWNWVLVPYLDGGYYAGTRMDTPIVNGTALHFRGAYNIEAIVKSVGFADATDIVITGCSSGAVSVIANAEFLRLLLASEASKSVRLSMFADSGYYQHIDTEYWTKPVLQMQQIGRTLSQSCIASNRDSPWDCIVGEVAAPFITRIPLFLAQSRYDTNQLECVKIDPSNITGVNAYGARILKSAQTWFRNHEAGDSPRGGFIDACSRHCSITSDIQTPTGANHVTLFGRFLEGPPRVVVQPGEYPCHTCCNAQTGILI